MTVKFMDMETGEIVTRRDAYLEFRGQYVPVSTPAPRARVIDPEIVAEVDRAMTELTLAMAQYDREAEFAGLPF